MKASDKAELPESSSILREGRDTCQGWDFRQGRGNVEEIVGPLVFKSHPRGCCQCHACKRSALHVGFK